MFDFGFDELVLIFIIGLLVLGPQRLPKVAAEIGKWVGRARRTATQLRRQLEREIELSEISSRRKRLRRRSNPPPTRRRAARRIRSRAPQPGADTAASRAEPGSAPRRRAEASDATPRIRLRPSLPRARRRSR